MRKRLTQSKRDTSLYRPRPPTKQPWEIPLFAEPERSFDNEIKSVPFQVRHKNHHDIRSSSDDGSSNDNSRMPRDILSRGYLHVVVPWHARV